MKPYLLRSKANRLADLKPVDISSDLNVIRISNSQELCWKFRIAFGSKLKSHSLC